MWLVSQTTSASPPGAGPQARLLHGTAPSWACWAGPGAAPPWLLDFHLCSRVVWPVFRCCRPCSLGQAGLQPRMLLGKGVTRGWLSLATPSPHRLLLYFEELCKGARAFGEQHSTHSHPPGQQVTATPPPWLPWGMPCPWAGWQWGQQERLQLGDVHPTGACPHEGGGTGILILQKAPRSRHTTCRAPTHGSVDAGRPLGTHLCASSPGSQQICRRAEANRPLLPV